MKKKYVRLTPELEKKYREWLRAQRAGLTFGEDDAEIPGRPLTDADSANIKTWMREANIGTVEFEEEGGYEDENETQHAAQPAKLPGQLNGNLRTWTVLGAIVLVIAFALALL